MQHYKHEQFPTPVSDDGRPKNISTTHSMQTAVTCSKHGQYEEMKRLWVVGGGVPAVQNCIQEVYP
jgi:hypothetical protein